MFTGQPADSKLNYRSPCTDPHSRITALGSQQCIDLANHGSGANGTPVQLWTSWGGENQKWEAREV